MPTIKSPFDNLQVKIPGLDKFTDAKECPNDPGKLCFSWIGEYIVGIYKYAIGIAGILATIVMMIGGFMWLIAGGNQSRISEAKAWIGASLTGLIIALSSYLILYQVNPNLVKFDALKVAQVKKPPDMAAQTGTQGLVKLNDIPHTFRIKTEGKGACTGECWLNTSLIEKLNAMTSTMSSDKWRVTEGYPPTVKHDSPCHYNGTCADIALTGDTSCAQVVKLMEAVQKAGLKFLNEYSNCKGKKYENTVGDHLHISL